MPRYRLAYLVTHSIQYQAPLLRTIAAEPDLDLRVFFCSDFSVGEFTDPNFGVPVTWDVPLLEGYRYEFLPSLAATRQPSFWRPLNYGLAKRLRKERFDLLWVHGWGNNVANTFAPLLARRLGLPVLMRTENCAVGTRRRDDLIQSLREVLKRRIIDACDVFGYIGRANRDYLLSYGVPAEHLFSMPYAVDNVQFRKRATEARPKRAAFRQSLRIEEGRPVILWVGKIYELKRLADMLAAYHKLSPDGREEPLPYLLIVGEGPERTELEAAAGNTGWQSIKFIGFVNQGDLLAYYDLADVLVISSRMEQWGIVVNEAMNCGCAIVASDRVGCAADLVCNGENGYVFPALDSDALAACLKKIFAEPDRLAQMQVESLRIIESYSYDQDVIGLREAIDYLVRSSKVRLLA